MPNNIKQDNFHYAHADALKKKRTNDSAVKNRFIASTLLTSAFIGSAIAGYFYTPKNYLEASGKYVLSNILSFVFRESNINPIVEITWSGKTFTNQAKQWSRNPFLKRISFYVGKRLAIGGSIGFVIGIGGLALTSNYRKKKQNHILEDRVLAGSILVNETKLAKITFEKESPNQLRIASVPIPSSLETRHMAIIGTTGSGKTTALRQLLDGIEARDQTAIVYDTSGEFIAHYYNPKRGDIILNPFDERGIYWNPFDEISHPADTDRIARYLINETGDRDRDIWLEAARNLVSNIMRKLCESGKCTPIELLNTLQFMKREELEVWLANTSSARIFAEDADKATGSVLFMLSKACNLLMFLRAEPSENSPPFSFSSYFKTLDNVSGQKPWIFIPRKEDYFEAIKPLMALWLECASSAGLGLNPSHDRRVWFILDEIADLPRVDNLSRLLPEGRKFGASVVLTFQAIGQMRSRYGNQIAEAMLGNCNTKLFMQLVDQDSRSWASDTIGKVEVEISNLSETIDPKTGKFNKTLSTSRQIRAAVLESELRLEKHQAYLLFPDGLPCAKIKLTNAHILARGGARHERFIPIDISQTLWGQMNSEKPQDSIISLSGGPV